LISYFKNITLFLYNILLLLFKKDKSIYEYNVRDSENKTEFDSFFSFYEMFERKIELFLKVFIHVLLCMK
jgi:hypothetical protein